MVKLDIASLPGQLDTIPHFFINSILIEYHVKLTRYIYLYIQIDSNHYYNYKYFFMSYSTFLRFYDYKQLYYSMRSNPLWAVFHFQSTYFKQLSYRLVIELYYHWKKWMVIQLFRVWYRLFLLEKKTLEEFSMSPTEASEFWQLCSIQRASCRTTWGYGVR